MKFKLGKWIVCAGCALSVLLTGCAGTNPDEAVDLRQVSLEVITEKAREEGQIASVGMPDDWANWKESWASITEKYGLAHEDADMSSAEELSLFEAEKDAATKDIGDVGQAFGPTAVEMGVVQPYKASTWESIPDWAKDPEGNWTIIAIQEINKEYPRQKTNQHSRMDESERKPEQYHAGAGVII